MKKSIILCGAGFMLLWACKKEVTVKVVEKNIAEPLVSESCYQCVQGNDTILMQLIRKGDSLQSGKLSYRFFEKDQNEGIVTGVFHGDTLLGKYKFKSEGMISVREVIFLKRGKSYIEGFGPVDQDAHGQVIFQNLKAIQFNDALPLIEIPCGN